MLRLAACVLLVLRSVISHAQVTYYVDRATGSNANPGTSLGRPWQTLQKACDTAPPGSTVLVRGGTYAENLVVNVSGTATQPILVKAYGREQVLVDGTGTPGAALLVVRNQSFLRFEHLIFQNLTAAFAKGIFVEAAGTGTVNDLIFKKVIIRRIRWTAALAAVPTSSDNAQGFIAYGRAGGITNLTLDSCEVSDNVLGFSEALTMQGNVSGFVIQHCLVHDNTNIGIDLAGNYGVSSVPATDQARNGVVRGNTCYRNRSAVAVSAGIYVDGGRDILLDGNRSYENGVGIQVGAEQNGTVENITVTNNLVYNNQRTGLGIGGYTSATTGQVRASVVRNNTFLFNDSGNNGVGELIIDKASDCRIENNVFYATAQNILFQANAIAPQAGNVLDYNCWYAPANNAANLTINWRGTAYASFAAYQAGTKQEVHSHYVDPQLTSPALAALNARLLAASPCRDAGNPATVLRAGETDFDGLARLTGARVDVGAFESAAAALPVQLVGFAAERTPPGNRLTWATASETDNLGFLVQASTDGKHFQRIGWVPGQGSAVRASTYSFLDPRPARVGQYYRLAQTDTDSSRQYSPVRYVAGLADASLATAELRVVPNPAGPSGTLLSGAAAQAQVRVVDVRGREVWQAQADVAGTVWLPGPASLPAGLYLVRSDGRSTRLVVE